MRDLYTTAVDYSPRSDAAQVFFAKVQNKMLGAVTGQTAAELIAARSDPDAANMGLTNWAGTVVRKGDVATGKNYLTQDEVAELNRIVTMYLDYAEDQARHRQVVTMAKWSDKLDAFLQFNGRHVLDGAGTLQASVAKALADDRYDEFDARRKATDAETADAADFAAIDRLGRETK